MTWGPLADYAARAMLKKLIKYAAATATVELRNAVGARCCEQMPQRLLILD